MLSPNIIILFDGAHASVPSGFSRETSLDSKFPKSSGAEAPNVTGGSATHSHTSPAHSHALAEHSHSYTKIYGQSAWLANSIADGSGIAQVSFHGGNTGALTGGTTSTTAVTYGAVSNNPPYYEFIAIKSTGYNFIPVNGVLLNKNTSRSGLVFHSASAGKYIKIAPTGQNAGSMGGSTTNVHPINHSHVANVHSHAPSTSTTNGANNQKNGSGGAGDASPNIHSHVFSAGNATIPIDDFVGSLTTLETVEPAYSTINAYKNESGSPVLPKVGDIAMWLGSVASIPIGWVLCDGNNDTPNLTDKFVKLNSVAGVPTTGGSNTHSHASQNHTHTTTYALHLHAMTSGNVLQNLITRVGSSQQGCDPQHYHQGNSNNTSASYLAGSTTGNSADNQPEYRTVAFIQFEFATGGGSIVTKMLN